MQDSIDLSELIHLLLQKLWLILLVSVIGFLFAFGFTKLAMKPQYTSSVKFYVSSTKLTGTDQSISSSQIVTAQELVNTYTVILQSDQVLNKIISAADLNYTAEELAKTLTISSVNGTEVMEVKVTTGNPQLSCDIANTIYSLAPQEIVEITRAGYLGQVDSAKANPVPTSPKTGRNCVIGFLLGFILAAMFVGLREMFDLRIKDEDDLKKHYNLPVLGSIPNFHAQFKGGYESYGR